MLSIIVINIEYIKGQRRLIQEINVRNANFIP